MVFSASWPRLWGTPRDPERSLRNRRARGPAVENPIKYPPVLDDRNAIHQHKLNPLGVLQRIFIVSFFSYAVIDNPLVVRILTPPTHPTPTIPPPPLSPPLHFTPPLTRT